ncbi:putative intracellular protease/amidase [Rhizobium sp. BK181]|nr:putative intracellular protease/amidase [Rhizobium sp. BK181]
MTQHVLFIVTNAAVIGPHNRKTGFFFAEVAHPFDVLDTAGIAVEFASPAGGWTPYDAYDEKDPAQKAFFESKAFRRLNRSRKLSEVDAADYDAILVRDAEAVEAHRQTQHYQAYLARVPALADRSALVLEAVALGE